MFGGPRRTHPIYDRKSLSVNLLRSPAASYVRWRPSRVGKGSIGNIVCPIKHSRLSVAAASGPAADVLGRHLTALLVFDALRGVEDPNAHAAMHLNGWRPVEMPHL